MRLVHDADQELFAEEVEAALREFARGVAPDQPGWHQLVERSGTPVTPLRSASLRGGVGSRWFPPSARPSLVAAAVIAAVLAGALLVNRTPDATPLEHAPASISAAAPTDASFDATTAPAVWFSETDDPVGAAQSYLESAGVPSAPAPGAPSAPALPAAPGVPPPPGAPALPSGPGAPASPTAPKLTLVDVGDGVAVVEWSVAGETYTSAGTVILRASADAGERVWSVVGSGSDDVALDDISYDGEHLSFAVTRMSELGGPVGIGVWADGRPLPLDDGLPVPDAAGDAGGPAGHAAAPAGAVVGQPVDLGAQPGSSQPVTVAIDGGALALLRVHNIVDGRVASVTEMAIDLTGAGAGGAGVAGWAEGEVDIHSDSVDVPPGEGAPSPSLPPEPSLPDLPGDAETVEPELPAPSGTLPTLPERESSPPSLPVPPPTTLGLP